MGIRLFKEVETKIKKSYFFITRISFIGHSLGGVIIRAALPYLEKYKDLMYTFMTFSSPHLGYFYHENFIFKTGLSIYSMWEKTTVLQ